MKRADWHVEKECKKFARWLRANNVQFCLTRRVSELAGAPQILILDKPPTRPRATGVAVLFKHPQRIPKDSQSDWLRAMERGDWVTVVAFYAEDAQDTTRILGYPAGGVLQ